MTATTIAVAAAFIILFLYRSHKWPVHIHKIFIAKFILNTVNTNFLLLENYLTVL
jgi:hypothetical protein